MVTAVRHALAMWWYYAEDSDARLPIGVIVARCLGSGSGRGQMSIVLYVGGSRDGEKGVMPYGFHKSMSVGAAGREIYVERVLALADIGKVRVMALESLSECIVVQRTAEHYRR